MERASNADESNREVHGTSCTKVNFNRIKGGRPECIEEGKRWGPRESTSEASKKKAGWGSGEREQT